MEPRTREWPKSLQHVVPHLKRTTFQPYSEMRMDTGDVVRRRLTSVPVPLFEASAILATQEQKTELERAS